MMTILCWLIKLSCLTQMTRIFYWVLMKLFQLLCSHLVCGGSLVLLVGLIYTVLCKLQCLTFFATHCDHFGVPLCMKLDF